MGLNRPIKSGYVEFQGFNIAGNYFTEIALPYRLLLMLIWGNGVRKGRLYKSVVNVNLKIQLIFQTKLHVPSITVFFKYELLTILFGNSFFKSLKL